MGLYRLIIALCLSLSAHTAFAAAPDASDPLYMQTNPDAAASFAQETGRVRFLTGLAASTESFDRFPIGESSFRTITHCPPGFNPYVILSAQQWLSQGLGFNAACVKEIQDLGRTETGTYIGYLVSFGVNLNADDSSSGTNFSWTLYCSKKPTETQAYCEYQFYRPMPYHQPPVLWDAGFETRGNMKPGQAAQLLGTGSVCPNAWKPYITLTIVSIINGQPIQGWGASGASFSSTGACVTNIDTSGPYIGYNVHYLLAARMMGLLGYGWPNNYFVTDQDKNRVSLDAVLPPAQYNNLNVIPYERPENASLHWELYCYPPGSSPPPISYECKANIAPYVYGNGSAAGDGHHNAGAAY